MRYRFVQMTRNGVWVSPGVFDDPLDAIIANVIRGHVVGQPRAAVALDSGDIIFALDANAVATSDPALFSPDRHEAA